MNRAPTIQPTRERLHLELLKNICEEPPLPWLYAEQEGERLFFEAWESVGYARRADPGKWVLTSDGEHLLIVPGLLNDEAKRVLNYIADFDLEHRTTSDYRDWILGLEVRSRMSASSEEEENRILASLMYWHLKWMVSPDEQFRLNQWGWLASKFRPRAIALIDGFLGLFRERFSRREFRGPYSFDDIRRQGGFEEATDCYLADQLVEGFDLGKRDGTGIWQVPTGQLKELLAYKSAHEFLTARAVRQRKGMIKHEAWEAGIPVRSYIEQFGMLPPAAAHQVSAWSTANSTIGAIEIGVRAEARGAVHVQGAEAQPTRSDTPGKRSDHGANGGAFLKDEQVFELHADAVATGLHENRLTLAAGLDRHLFASLPSVAEPGAQLLADLFALNELAKAGNSAPLALWLRTALALRLSRPQASTFRLFLAQMMAEEA